MGFRESVFGAPDEAKFIKPEEEKAAKDARAKLVAKTETGLLPTPLRGVAEVAAPTAESKLARSTATDLAKPREQFDFASSPEVQGIIQQTVEEGNLLANRIGRSLQKSGGFQATTGRDILGRTVKEVEGNIAANLAQFAEAERGRDFADKSRRLNVVSVLERLGLTEETREQQTEQDKLNAIFSQESGELSQEQQLIALLQNIIQLDPSRNAQLTVQEARPGLIEQINAIGSVFAPRQSN